MLTLGKLMAEDKQWATNSSNNRKAKNRNIKQIRIRNYHTHQSPIDLRTFIYTSTLDVLNFVYFMCIFCGINSGWVHTHTSTLTKGILSHKCGRPSGHSVWFNFFLHHLTIVHDSWIWTIAGERKTSCVCVWFQFVCTCVCSMSVSV